MTSESLRATEEAKASERAVISFTGNYMLKCSVSSNTLCEAKSGEAEMMDAIASDCCS